MLCSRTRYNLHIHDQIKDIHDQIKDNSDSKINMGAVISKRKSKRLSTEQRISHLKKTPFFLYLKGDKLREFAECFPYTNKQGKEIELEQDTIYIVAHGELQLHTTIPLEQKAKLENKGYLCKKYPGDIVSKHQAQTQAICKLSAKNKKLSAFVEEVQTTACDNTVLIYSDHKALDHFLSVNKELADPIKAIVNSHIETSLTSIPFLSTVKNSQLSVLAAMCQYEAIDANQIVFKENSRGTKLYILLNGSATVLAPQWVGNATALQQSLEWGASDDKVVVADLKNGDYFGETAMFINVNRTSTVLTKEKCLFVTVEKRTFENFLKVCPIREAMTLVMKERMVSKLSSLEIPFLAGIPPEKLKSLTASVEVHETEDGDVIFSEGEVGVKFYIIVHGQVKVETGSAAKVKGTEVESLPEQKQKRVEGVRKPLEESNSLGILSAGNYFGEMALVSDSPRSATVITISKAILLSVDKGSFHNIFSSNKQALAEFRLRLLRGSSELRHLLDHSMGVSAFRSFLKRSLAEENLNFWIEATEFNELERDKNDLRQKAHEIFHTYCDEDAEHQVNLPCSIRSKLKISLEQGEMDRYIFDDAVREIYQLMVKDIYVRFRKTPDFHEFFKSLGVLSLKK